jgi:hypothetical protein
MIALISTADSVIGLMVIGICLIILLLVFLSKYLFYKREDINWYMPTDAKGCWDNHHTVWVNEYCPVCKVTIGEFQTDKILRTNR